MTNNFMNLVPQEKEVVGRSLRDSRKGKQVRKPSVKENVVPKCAVETVQLKESLDYVTKLERNGTGVPSKSKFNGTGKNFREEVENNADARVDRKAALLSENGLKNDAKNVAGRHKKKKEKALYTRTTQHRVVSARRAKGQLEKMEDEFDKDVAATWGTMLGEYDTLAAKESDEEYKKWYDDSVKASDEEYKNWYDENANKAREDEDKAALKYFEETSRTK